MVLAPAAGPRARASVSKSGPVGSTASLYRWRLPAARFGGGAASASAQAWSTSCLDLRLELLQAGRGEIAQFQEAGRVGGERIGLASSLRWAGVL